MLIGGGHEAGLFLRGGLGEFSITLNGRGEIAFRA